MRVIFLVVCLSLLSFFASGQSPFSIGLSASLGTDPMTITKSNAELSNNGIYEESGAGFDWEIGIKSLFKVSEKYQLTFGVSFQESNYRHFIKGIRFPDPIYNGREPSMINNRVKYRSVNFPVSISKIFYRTNRSEMYWGLSGRFRYGLSSKTRAFVDNDGLDNFEHEEASNDFDPSWLALGTHMGFQKNITKRLTLQVQAQLIYNRNKFELYLLKSEAVSRFHPSLQLNLLYGFPKKQQTTEFRA